MGSFGLEFAEARGWEVVAEFVDAGETGTNMDRPGLQNALKAAEEEAFDVLLVHANSPGCPAASTTR